MLPLLEHRVQEMTVRERERPKLKAIVANREEQSSFFMGLYCGGEMSFGASYAQDPTYSNNDRLFLPGSQRSFSKWGYPAKAMFLVTVMKVKL